jgi:serine/threonine protein kinase
MGEVFLATRRDDPKNTRIVVKRMRPDVADEPENEKRLLFEAQVAARLKHPNLVRLLELGRVGDCMYLAMEHVPGFSLRRLLDDVIASDHPPPPEAAVGIASGMLDGLAEMHRACEDSGASRPILHRDVTPQNVIITHEGRPVLIDFGIAKDVLGPAITKVGRVVGTAPYMSPEHRHGSFVDARSDVFSVSVIFFELLCARYPWARMDSMKELLRVVFDPPELTPEVAARVPKDILPVLYRGLECDPHRRFADAAEMLQALRATGTFRSMAGAGGAASWAPIRAWVERLAIAPDEALDGPTVNHRAASSTSQAAIAAQELIWSSSGELAPAPVGEPLSGEIHINSSVLSIPPLPPRRESSIAAEELEAVSAYAESLGAQRRRLRSWAGVLVVTLVGMGLLAVAAARWLS